MTVLGRRTLMVGAALVAAGGVGALVVSCNGANGQSGAASADDMALGAENAPVTIIEYASVTCPHCGEFHHAVWEQLKANYIDTGKVRFIFREYPTAPPQVAVAGFQLARCGGANPEQYFTRLGVLFEQRSAILGAGTMEGVRQKFLEIGGAANLSEEQVMACITDEAGAERIQRTVETGTNEFDIDSTPTLILNGEKLPQDASSLTYEGLSRRIDAAIAN